MVGPVAPSGSRVPVEGLTSLCLVLRVVVVHQGALGAAVFRKAMRLSPGGRHDVGNVVNLMSVDASSVFGAIPQVTPLCRGRAALCSCGWPVLVVGAAYRHDRASPCHAQIPRVWLGPIRVIVALVLLFQAGESPSPPPAPPLLSWCPRAPWPLVLTR